jgi:ParB family chromosome partitioning protein
MIPKTAFVTGKTISRGRSGNAPYKVGVVSTHFFRHLRYIIPYFAAFCGKFYLDIQNDPVLCSDRQKAMPYQLSIQFRKKDHGVFLLKKEVQMATDATYIPGQLYLINLNDLLPDPDQPRKYIDPAALAEMVESIKEHGIIQPPTFRVGEGDLRYIVTGERRCTAARMAGLTEISAIYTDSDRYDELSLVENILRSDLTAVEEAEAMDRLMKKHSYSLEDLARKVSKSKSSVVNTLSLNKLPPEVLDDCRKDPAMPKRVLMDIAQKKQERSMATAYRKYKARMSPQKKTRTGGKVSKVQTAFNAMDAMERMINNLDLQALEPGDRELFLIALGNLRQAIENKQDSVLR